MPFDFEDYQKKCNGMTTEQLNKEWDNYTRQITSGSTSTATSVLFSPLTGGVSLVGLGIAAPRIHNARKKREIIEAGLQARGTTHYTHTMDVLGPMATVGAVSTLTLGLGVTGVELLPSKGAEQSAADYAVGHAAALGTVEYVRLKAKELSRKKEDAPRPELPTANSWPLDPPVLEKYGPQCRPTIQPYSLFGHYEDEELEPEMAALSFETHAVPVAQSSLGSASPASLSESLTIINSDVISQTSVQHNPPQNGCSQSLPSLSSTQPASQVRHAYVELPCVQPEDTSLLSEVAIADTKIQDFVAVLSEEEQKMFCIRREMTVRQTKLQRTSFEARVPSIPPLPQLQVETDIVSTSHLQTSPVTSQLHRSHHVHSAHEQRPHPKARDNSHRASSRMSPESDTTPCFSMSLIQGMHSIDGQRPDLPPPAPSLPVRPDSTQAQPPPLPSRSPSLPIEMTSSTATMAALSRNSQIFRKPLPSNQVHSPMPPKSQTLQVQLEDNRQDSGYYSTASTPPLFTQPFYPPPPPPRQTPSHRDSASSLSPSTPTQPPPTYSSLAAPPPTYYPPPAIPTTREPENYFTKPVATYTAEQSQKNVGGGDIHEWQSSRMETVGMAGKGGTGTGVGVKRGVGEPDYGPPPAIPGVWRGS